MLFTHPLPLLGGDFLIMNWNKRMKRQRNTKPVISALLKLELVILITSLQGNFWSTNME